MLRHFVAFGLLAAALTVLPEPSSAGPSGARGGIGGGARIGGFRPIPQFRGLPRGAINGPRLVGPRPVIGAGLVGPVGGGLSPVSPPAFRQGKIPPSAVGAFTYRGSRLVRLYHHHHRRGGGLVLPVSGYGDFGYFGAPYDPGEAIPVYAPAPVIQQVDTDPAPETTTPRRVPVLTRARGEGEDACSAEKVTVPAQEGQREITVVRC